MSGPPVEFAVSSAKKILESFYVKKENRTVTRPNVTSLNTEKIPLGAFYIEKDNYETFLAHVAKIVFEDRVPIGLTERPLNEADDGTRLSPLRIDLDFRFKPESPFIDRDGDPQRQTTDAMFQTFLKLLWEELVKIVDFTDFETNEVTFYVLQKPSPEYEKDKNVIKDGVHFFCKSIQLLPELHLYLRHKMLDKMEKIFPSEFFQVIDKTLVYDETVLYKGGWTMHGNHKPGKKPYNVIFRSSFQTTNPSSEPIITRSRLTREDNKQLVKTLSIRYGIEGIYAPRLNDEIKTDFQEFVKKNTKAQQSLGMNALQNYSDPMAGPQSSILQDHVTRFGRIVTESLDKTNDLATAAWLVDMLSVKRAEAYDTWVNVGICLRNMSRIEGLPDVRMGSMKKTMKDDHTIVADHGMFNLWVEFSRKSPRYIEGIEEKEDWYNKFWLTFTSRSNYDSMIKRPTLRLWAKNDSPERYQEYLGSDIDNEILRVVKGGGTHVDVAHLARIMYGDEFICANIKNSIWFQFDKTCHRFIRCDSATTLRRNLSREVRTKFEAFANKRNNELTARNERFTSGEISSEEPTIQVDIGKDEYIKTAHAISRSLGQTKFLNDVITECKHRFYETYGDEFIRKLDVNKNFIGFNNGVYDLEYGVFREGRPEDMISRTVGYDFVPYDEFSPKTREIYSIFSKIFTDPKVNEYMWAIMASVLRGENWRQEIYFLNGIGANGKSVLASWMLKALGEYAIKPNVSILTDKRSNAQNASPETYSLKGMRFVYMEEPDEGANIQLNNGLMKDWSGGGQLRGRPLYGESESFNCMFKLFFSCNKFPQVTTEEALWRRLKVIEFTSKFVKMEHQIRNPEREFLRNEKYASDDFITEHCQDFMSILIHKYGTYWSRSDYPPIEEPESVQQFSKTKRMESEVIHDIFDNIFTTVEDGVLASVYIGDDAKIKETFCNEDQILNAVLIYRKNHSEVKSRIPSNRGRLREIVRNYLNIIAPHTMEINDNGTMITYYPYILNPDDI